MSRESKLALIIGFTLILIVGVLVSDHLSKASRDRLDEPAAATASGGPGAVLPPVAERRLLHDAIVQAQREPETLVRDPLLAEPGRVVVEAPRATLTPEVTPAAPGPVVFSMGSGSEAGSPVPSAFEEPIQRLASAAGIALDRVSNGSRPLVQTAPTLAGSTIRAGSAVREHEVAEGESLFQIAAKLLGSGHRWPEIRDANPGVVDADGGVRAGAVLRIPGGEPAAARSGEPAVPARPQTAAAGVGKTDAKKADAKKAEPAKSQAPRPAGRAGQYVVQKGDTLGGIAQKTLGSVKRMGEILDANESKIRDANDIKVGMTLTIPAR